MAKKRILDKDPNLMRIQKYISLCGITSRRNAEKMIQEGKVQLNGKKVTEMGVLVNIQKDKVKVEGNEINLPGCLFYIAMNKPRFVVTTMHDPQNRPSVADLLSELPLRVYPVGRLDFDSEGLLLLTNDGNMANRIMHPRYHIPKIYRVEWEQHPSKENIAKFKQGVFLDGKKVRPESLRLIKEFANSVIYEIVLNEGKNRQIRRMSQALNLKVLQLKRIAIGEISLGDLAPGKYRHLNEKELAYLRSALDKKLI